MVRPTLWIAIWHHFLTHCGKMPLSLSTEKPIERLLAGNIRTHTARAVPVLSVAIKSNYQRCGIKIVGAVWWLRHYRFFVFPHRAPRLGLPLRWGFSPPGPDITPAGIVRVVKCVSIKPTAVVNNRHSSAIADGLCSISFRCRCYCKNLVACFYKFARFESHEMIAITPLCLVLEPTLRFTLQR